MISIPPQWTLDEKEITEEFIRASGPGGQNVNKVATAVQLRFDVRHSPSLSETVRARVIRLAGKRINADGMLIIEARRFRTQEQNRADARARLSALIRQAATPPPVRHQTQPTRAAKQKRLEHKRQQSQIKQTRRITHKDLD